MKPHFGNFLRRVRRELHMTQEVLAEHLRVTRESVYKMEKRAQPERQTQLLYNLAVFLGLSSEEELEHVWRAGVIPDVERIRKRLHLTAEISYRGGVVTMTLPLEQHKEIEVVADRLSVPVEEMLRRHLSGLVVTLMSLAKDAKTPPSKEPQPAFINHGRKARRRPRPKGASSEEETKDQPRPESSPGNGTPPEPQ